MSDKTKVSLIPEQETMLITLYAKAQPDNPLFFDPIAREILNRVDYDFTELKVPKKSVFLVCQRTKKLDAVTREFLVENPNGVVLHLGCGLDSRFWRVDNGLVEWYDLEMPQVVALRQHFFEPVDRYHLIASSVTDLTWISQVKAADRPVLVVAEGLLMYLDEVDVRSLFIQLRKSFPNCRLVADVFSRLTARTAINHASLKQTGASLGWGIDDSREIESWEQGIQLKEEWFFNQDPDLHLLSARYRLAYKIASVFKIARNAHRIVTYQL